MGRRKNMWIQEAIKRPGALRAYVKRKYGKKGFTRSGTIKVSLLRSLARSAKNVTVRRRALLALTLRRLSRRRR